MGRPLQLGASSMPTVVAKLKEIGQYILAQHPDGHAAAGAARTLKTDDVAGGRPMGGAKLPFWSAPKPDGTRLQGQSALRPLRSWLTC